MPSRIMYKKRIVSPFDPDPKNPTQYVDIPVIAAINLHDAKDFAQDRIWVFDNTSSDAGAGRGGNAYRIPHRSVDDQGNITKDRENYVNAEQPTAFQIKDIKEFAQERTPFADGAASPEVTKSHFVRWSGGDQQAQRSGS